MEEKGYTGFDFNDVEGEDDIVSRLATLKINVDSDCKYSCKRFSCVWTTYIQANIAGTKLSCHVLLARKKFLCLCAFVAGPVAEESARQLYEEPEWKNEH